MTAAEYERVCTAIPGSEPVDPSETPGPSDSNSVNEPSASPSISVGGPSGSNSGSIAPTCTRSVPTGSVTTPPGDAAFRIAADAGFGVILTTAIGFVLAL